MTEPLKLVALDPEDLAMISAHLQDAVVRADDLAWRKSERRFALILRRFDWEAPDDEPRRRLAGLHFERVSSVRRRGFGRRTGDVLNLLAVIFHQSDLPAGTVTFVFSGGAAIRLEVDCVEAQLKDLGPAWEASGRPMHQSGGDA